MKQANDQTLLAFALGELPLLQRLAMRIQLKLSRPYRVRLEELQGAVAAIAGVYVPSEPTAFRANLAVRLRRFFIIDLSVGLVLLGVGATACVISVTNYVRDNCEVPTVTQKR